MPIDLDRLPGGAADLLRASTASCLIGHALAFKRLQQTAGMLFSGPSPSPAAVLDIARRRGDTALVYVITVCAPLLRGVMAVCTEAEQVSMPPRRTHIARALRPLRRLLAVFIAGKYSREQAVLIASELEDPYKDVNGVYTGGELAIKTNLPDELLDAAIIRRSTAVWQPPVGAGTAEAFIKLLDLQLADVGRVEDALVRLLSTDATALAAKIIDAMSDRVEP